GEYDVAAIGRRRHRGIRRTPVDADVVRPAGARDAGDLHITAARTDDARGRLSEKHSLVRAARAGAARADDGHRARRAYGGDSATVIHYHAVVIGGRAAAATRADDSHRRAGGGDGRACEMN